MPALSNQPTNTNMLDQAKFRLAFNRLPNVQFFCTSAPLPGLTLGVADVPTPFVNMPYPGTKLEFDQLTVTFKIDEDMRNYEEILNWMVGLGFPDNFDQYAPFSRARPTSDEGVFSDATLLPLTSKLNNNISFFFRDMFPVSMTPVDFDYVTADVDYAPCTATFAYQSFKIERNG